ncbi:MAG: hypothetical protein FWE95_07195 [Planctomycetaceae bacterium]|nr:hypothetical protein [Planctomycetaceae bacterium]
MATLDLSQIKPIPGFDCVKMKREIQAEIYEETKHMTWEERREHTRKASERFWADIERRRAAQTALVSTDN